MTKNCSLVQGAIRLSSHVIAKDPGQFASQMVGRLLPYKDMPAIKEFSKRVQRAAQNSGCGRCNRRCILRGPRWFAPRLGHTRDSVNLA